MFPIYKYIPSENKMIDHYAPSAAWLGGIVLAMFWSFMAANQIKPHYIGALILVVL
jgi:hypothetical protein